MLNSLKTLKRSCKVTLNVFFKKKKLMMTKIFIYIKKFLCQIKVLLLDM